MFATGSGDPSYSDCPGRGNVTRHEKKARKSKRRRGFRPNGGAGASEER